MNASLPVPPASLDAFGPARCMFGSDYPVARRTMAFPDLVQRFRAVVADHSADEQRDLFRAGLAYAGAERRGRIPDPGELAGTHDPEVTR